MLERVKALPAPAHTLLSYAFPPAYTADVYGRGDAAARIAEETQLSSVLLVLLEHRGIPHVLLTRRTGKISHGGEVAFPVRSQAIQKVYGRTFFSEIDCL